MIWRVESRQVQERLHTLKDGHRVLGELVTVQHEDVLLPMKRSKNLISSLLLPPDLVVIGGQDVPNASVVGTLEHRVPSGVFVPSHIFY